MDPARGASFHASKAILYDSMGTAGMAIHRLRGGHMRAEDTASGPSGHAPQTRLRGAVRQLPAQDRHPGEAYGARPHAGLKLQPPTLVATLSSIWIWHRMPVTPWDRRFLP